MNEEEEWEAIQKLAGATGFVMGVTRGQRTALARQTVKDLKWIKDKLWRDRHRRDKRLLKKWHKM